MASVGLAGPPTSRSEPPAGLARTLRFCGPARCGTLTWGGDHYDARYDAIAVT